MPGAQDQKTPPVESTVATGVPGAPGRASPVRVETVAEKAVSTPSALKALTLRL